MPYMLGSKPKFLNPAAKLIFLNHSAFGERKPPTFCMKFEAVSSQILEASSLDKPWSLRLLLHLPQLLTYRP